MDIDRIQVGTIADRWRESHVALTDAATSVGDAGGDWAPAVRSAVAGFAEAWKADVRQLAAEAQTTSDIVRDAAWAYGTTDQRTADAMRRIQQSVAPPS